MRSAPFCSIVAVAASVVAVVACGGMRAPVRLEPEIQATLRVGETAAIHVASDRGFHLGAAGSALALMTQRQRDDTTIYTYRAVEPGDQTFVATPRETGPDGCVSCVTVHYFIRVIP